MSGYDYSSYYGAGAGAADQPGTAAVYGGGYAAPPGGYAPPPYSAHPPPPYGAPHAYAAPPMYGAPPPASATDEVRTIFITGFPADVKERELNNMLRFMPGYEASQMTWKNGAAQGFALFNTPSLARAACDQITQLIFDDTSTLRCEMARKNMYVKDMDPSGKRARTGPGTFTGATTYPPPGAPAAAAPTAAPGAYRPPAYSGSAPAPTSTGPIATAGATTTSGDNPPCNTLFVGNLSETVNEAELSSIFATAPGFRQLKVVRGRNTTAFVEFDTIENASAVHAMHQGTVLASNADRGGIRLQFSRNPFGKKRDVAGAMIDTPVRQPDYNAPTGGAAPGAGGVPAVAGGVPGL